MMTYIYISKLEINDTFINHYTKEVDLAAVSRYYQQNIMDVTNGITFRAPQPGDIGYIIHRHGQLYYQEYGCDASAEIYIARAMVGFMENFNPATQQI